MASRVQSTHILQLACGDFGDRIEAELARRGYPRDFDIMFLISWWVTDDHRWGHGLVSVDPEALYDYFDQDRDTEIALENQVRSQIGLWKKEYLANPPAVPKLPSAAEQFAEALKGE